MNARLEAAKQAMDDAHSCVEQQRARIVTLDFLSSTPSVMDEAERLLSMMICRAEVVKLRYESMIKTDQLVKETRQMIELGRARLNGKV